MAERKKPRKEMVQCYGRKKTATAVATCTKAKNAQGGVFRINGVPIDLVEPKILRTKVLEPILLLGPKVFGA